MSDHHWVTLHRVRFSEAIAALERSFAPVAEADCWRFCVSHTMGDNDLPTWTSDIWCGMGIWNSRAEAEAMLANPVAAMPFLDEAIEAWHALTLPVQHRGEVRWRGVLETNSAITPSRNDPRGRLAIVTSASFDDPTNPDELPRISRFAVKVAEAIDFLDRQPGNLRRDVFNGGFDGREGFTLSLWDNDEAMLKAAYHSGHHRDLMGESRDGSLFDRSSFTRLRILESHGSWDGDPLAGPV